MHEDSINQSCAVRAIRRISCRLMRNVLRNAAMISERRCHELEGSVAKFVIKIMAKSSEHDPQKIVP